MPGFRTILLLLAASLTAAAAAAQEYTVGAIKVGRVWTREVPGGAKVAAGFMTITNSGKVSDTLIGGSVPIAGMFEVHEMKMEGGLMKMRRLEPGLVIKPGETVVLKPGSIHLMFLNLKQGPKRGTPLKGTLAFDKAGQIEVEYAVEAVGARDLGTGAQPGGKDDTKPKGGSHGQH
jgi:copper(I)-binding protein